MFALAERSLQNAKMDFPRFLFPGLPFFLEIDMIITQKKISI